MNGRSIIRSTVCALVVGMLAALPAYAGSGLNKITHGATVLRSSAQPASSTVAKAQPKVSQAKPEIQVAVMAKSPSQPAARRSVYIRR